MTVASDKELAKAIGQRAHESVGEPEQVAPEEEGVAGAAQEQVAEEVSEETPEDLTEDERFRAWQSKMDKRIAELEARNQELQAQIAQRQDKGPTAAERSAQEAAARQWQTVIEQLNQAEEAGDVAQVRDLSRQLLNAERAALRADAVVAARTAGIDPNHPQLRQALDEGVSNYYQLEALAYRIAMNDLQTRLGAGEGPAAKPAQGTSALRQRQESGLNRVPGSAPRGASSARAALEREYGEAKESGDLLTALRIKTQLTQLEQEDNG